MMNLTTNQLLLTVSGGLLLVLLLVFAFGCSTYVGPKDKPWLGWEIKNEMNLDFSGFGIELCIGCLEGDDPNRPPGP